MNQEPAQSSNLPNLLPALRDLKRRLWKTLNVDGRKGTSTLDVLSEFPLFTPSGAGVYAQRASLTIKTIQNAFPFLESFSAQTGHSPLSLVPVESLATTPGDIATVEELKKTLDAHKSDKARKHNYHHLYGTVLKNRNAVTAVLEIGLGTNNTDVVSNMGKGGVPGASLRAFRDFFPNANIYGADVDARILFTEERIKTFYVDQTNLASCEELAKQIPEELDLIIDDGLHSIDANIAILGMSLPKIKKGGWVIIEDIAHNTLPFWQVVTALLPTNYKATIYQANDALMFAVTKVS
jgi:hypothetical protein